MRAGNLRKLLALGALFVALPASADYRDSYSRGLEAAKDGNWADVRRYMSDALAEHAEPAVRIRLYGQRWESYVPQYYLGLAAFKQGDCKTALERWRNGAESAVFPGVDEKLRTAKQADTASCDQRLAQTKTDNGKPDTGKPDVVKVEPVKPDVTKPDVVKTDPIKTDPIKVKTDPVVKTDPIKTRPDVLPVGQRVPQPLIDAVKAWLAGRYDEVSRINPDAYAEPRARVQALVLRAAARYTLAELDGNRDALEAVRTDLRALRQIDARFQPDATLFSPRFRSFYADLR